jgi:hypothetical protein
MTFNAVPFNQRVFLPYSLFFPVPARGKDIHIAVQSRRHPPIFDTHRRVVSPVECTIRGGARVGERTKLGTENWPIHVDKTHTPGYTPAYAMTVGEFLSNQTCIFCICRPPSPQSLQLAVWCGSLASVNSHVTMKEYPNDRRLERNKSLCLVGRSVGRSAGLSQATLCHPSASRSRTRWDCFISFANAWDSAIFVHNCSESVSSSRSDLNALGSV